MTDKHTTTNTVTNKWKSASVRRLIYSFFYPRSKYCKSWFIKSYLMGLIVFIIFYFKLNLGAPIIEELLNKFPIPLVTHTFSHNFFLYLFFAYFIDPLPIWLLGKRNVFGNWIGKRVVEIGGISTIYSIGEIGLYINHISDKNNSLTGILIILISAFILILFGDKLIINTYSCKNNLTNDVTG